MKSFNETTPKVSYSQHDFIKLKELWDAIQHSQKQLDDKKQGLQNAVANSENHRDSSSLIQNKQIRLRMYKEQIKQQKLRIYNAQMKLNAAEEAKEKRVIDKQNLGTTIENLEEKSKNEAETLSIQSLPLIKVKNELIYRRRYMIFELYTIYFSETSMDRREDRTCLCNKYDAIRGMHLPIIATKNGHTEIEITAALGHLVNALNSLCKILDYPLLFPVFFKGSKSFLLEQKSHQIYNLFDPFSRNHKDRYAHALSFFNRAIVQLRHDLGMITRDYERPIQNMQEILLYCIGQVNLSPAHFVPRTNIYSISSIVPDLQKISINERQNFQQIMKKKSRQSDDDNILDVVSAKNETFDVQKLVSRSLT